MEQKLHQERTKTGRERGGAASLEGSRGLGANLGWWKVALPVAGVGLDGLWAPSNPTHPTPIHPNSTQSNTTELTPPQAAPGPRPAISSPHRGRAHLEDGGLEVQQQLVALQLPDADGAAELAGGGAEALQGEGAQKGPGAAAPHAGERHLLQDGDTSGTGDRGTNTPWCSNNTLLRPAQERPLQPQGAQSRKMRI